MSDVQLRKDTISESLDDLEVAHLSLEDENDLFFAKVIGLIEDIILEDKFIKLHTNFLDKHWKEFDNADENKLVYMDIFRDYVETIEMYLETQLKQKIVGFSMNQFEDELKKRQKELDGQIFEILDTFSDFGSFKSMVLDYKAMKEGNLVDFSNDIFIKKYDISMEK